MSAEPVPLRRLAPVDLDTGEVVDPEVAVLQNRIASLEDALKEAEKDLRAKRSQITKLKKDLVKERFEYERREDVIKVHAYYNRRLGTTRALTADRFDAIRDRLEEVDLAIVDGKATKRPAFKYPDDFKQAIDGAWFDPFSKPMKNGKVQKYDDLATIFKSAKSMKMHMDRAPVRAQA